MNYKKRSVCEFIITKIDHIVEHIIPFFDKHHILGSKHSNFLYFKRASYIIKNKEHLNNDGLGLKEILQLKGRITSLTQIRLWIITESSELPGELFSRLGQGIARSLRVA